MTDQRDIPAAPLLLGLTGLLPFWAIATAMLWHIPPAVPRAQLAAAVATYGAVILSFLGGIRWGLTMTTTNTRANYVISVVPSLAGWALVLVPDPWRLVGLGIVLTAFGPIDLKLVSAGAAPFWFGRLRLMLSSGAGIALLLAALATA